MSEVRKCRKCRKPLPENYPKATHEECLAAERNADKKLREKRNEMNDKNEDDDSKICTECGKKHRLKSFISIIKKADGTKKKLVTKRCSSCREKGKKVDANRERDRKDEYKKYDQSEAGQARKKRHKENNPTASSIYSKRYRDNKKKHESDSDEESN